MKLEKNELVKSTRAAYGEVLQEIGEEFPDVVVMDADLSESTMTCHFAEKYPDRFYNMGIAEQSMMGTAAGLATCGITPICSTFAVFASMRSGEQIRTSICYPKLNVKVVTTHSGLSIGTAGATHFCEEDLAIMRALPNMTVIAPSDFLETKKAVRAALKMDGPVYIRLGRGDAAVLYSELDDYEIGKAITIQDGTDVTLIATGVMVQRAELPPNCWSRRASAAGWWICTPSSLWTRKLSSRQPGKPRASLRWKSTMSRAAWEVPYLRLWPN